MGTWRIVLKQHDPSVVNIETDGPDGKSVRLVSDVAPSVAEVIVQAVNGRGV